MADAKERIARRAARELQDGWTINLGIGIPTLVGNYLPKGVSVLLHSENGFLGLGPEPEPGGGSPYLTNAGGSRVSILPGGMCFGSDMSFALTRGGHVDATILGALQVDEQGRIASWMVPGVRMPGMGGAMDLLAGVKRVIVAMQHTASGAHKILPECTIPLTALRCADLIITDLCVLRPTPQGLLLAEIAPGLTPRDVQAQTGARLVVPDAVPLMQE